MLNDAPPVQRLEAHKKKLTQRAANRTGLPDHVKGGVEALSGLSMDHVRVHYNSPKPAQLNAHAYAQGSKIHVAPGQERHVPHEAWHVVQQAQGRVRATTQLKGGVPLNEDKALESEADRVGQMVSQRAPLVSSRDKQNVLRVPASPVSQRQVVQAVRSVAAFQAQTPARFLHPRNRVTAIDTALANYIAAGANKLVAGNVLVAAIHTYTALQGRVAARVTVANQLLAEVNTELPLVAALGANAGLTDDLIRRAGGPAAIPELTQLATSITGAEAGVLPQLVQLSLGHLPALDLLIQHIQPANAHMLARLIPAAGGAADLGELDNIIQHATLANVLQLYTLIPAGAGAGLPALDALIQAAGAATVPQLVGMIRNAGGDAAIPDLTAAINRNHPGQGQHTEALTTYAGTNLGEFQRLVALLPNFAQNGAMPGVPGNVTAAMASYNNVGTGVLGALAGVPINPAVMKLKRIEWNHFLQRHTMEFFDFGAISPHNDQWPAVGGSAAVATDIGDKLAAGLMDFANNAVGAWWLKPQNPVTGINVGGGMTATMGTKIENPADGNGAKSVLGQFFPEAGGGVHVLDNGAMRAIHALL
ncbi:MAG: DUF4157 domain-containing protein [Novosphingobium sp.]